MAVGWEARAWAARRPERRRAIAAAGVAAVLGLAVAAHQQVRHWRNSETLFAHAVAVTRGNAFAHAALGAAHRERGDLVRAEQELAEALRIRPASGDARSDLGLVRLDQGRLGEARAELLRALADGGDAAKVHAGLGLAAERSGDLAEAIASYRAALRANPQRVEAANNLAWILATAPDANLRAPAEAVEIALRVARWNPHDPSVLDTLAAAYAAAGRYGDAAATQARALAALGPGAGALRADLQSRLERYEAQRRTSN
jgi:spermidine synthase